MSELLVGDGFRTNPLSKQPGGSKVKIIHENGKVFVYDKIKSPEYYIKNLNENGPNGLISEICVNDVRVWLRGFNKEHFRNI